MKFQRLAGFGELAAAVVAVAAAMSASLAGAAPEGYLPKASLAPSARQLRLFNTNCVQCHLRVGVGAPLAGHADDWKARAAQGEDVMLKHTVEGLRGMPPLGYCSACDEADFRALIRLMAATASNAETEAPAQAGSKKGAQ
ncbi:c-type cytochrome [Roseateles koreensis]|uniref:C-type cytochrome n=1 Tax=Roseateles koreensis TaxID=2987526 RepID=A0ABT5KM22_9BURK|nr:c-type cytochrome [Roseateles koreensis]MDC8783958.1 c-type cytochrome [Roseateles koreensis]